MYAGSVHFNGVAYGLGASVIVPLNGIYTKKYLHSVEILEKNEARLLLVTYFNALILFFPFALVTGDFSNIFNISNWLHLRFCSILIVSSVFAIGMFYVSVICIDVTSPLTHSISGNAKSALQTIIGVVCCVPGGKTSLWWVGNLLVLMGCIGYALIRRKEMIHKIQKSQSSFTTEIHFPNFPNPKICIQSDGRPLKIEQNNALSS